MPNVARAPVRPVVPSTSSTVVMLRPIVPGPIRFSRAERTALVALEYRFRVGMEFFCCDEGDEGAALVSEAEDRSVVTIVPTRGGIGVSDASFAPLGTFRTPSALSTALVDHLDHVGVAERHGRRGRASQG